MESANSLFLPFITRVTGEVPCENLVTRTMFVWTAVASVIVIYGLLPLLSPIVPAGYEMLAIPVCIGISCLMVFFMGMVIYGKTPAFSKTGKIVCSIIVTGSFLWGGFWASLISFFMYLAVIGGLQLLALPISYPITVKPCSLTDLFRSTVNNIVGWPMLCALAISTLPVFISTMITWNVTLLILERIDANKNRSVEIV